MQQRIDELKTVLSRPLRRSGPALLIFGIAAALHAQSFPSGSTGADGDLIVNTAGVTTFKTAPVGGGNIYNFKTINIASGSTLRLSGAVFSGPLYFLAQGAVTIAGTLDLSGQAGFAPISAPQRTVPTTPGAGGFSGGAAAYAGNAALPGLGPLGGAVNTACTSGLGGGPGGQSATPFLVPLVGGSGGAGANGMGGAGGGAILIASSVSITVSGTITAAGGGGYGIPSSSSGGGAGGSIRLVAPLIAGFGTITAAGGPFYYCTNSGANGTVRLEAYTHTYNGTTGGNVYTASPIALYLPAANTQPSIAVTSIGGIAVPASPSGTFTVPDVLLNSTSPLVVDISAVNVPPGTKPTVYFLTQNYPDQTFVAPALGGTLASSSTTLSVTLNPGYSIGYVTATWVQ